MSLHLPVAPGPGPAGTDPSSAGAQAAGVQVLVCGSPDRGDDGVAVAAAAMIRDQLPDGVRMRTVGQLDIDDLLAVPAAVGVVIVDAASGLRPGQIVDLPLTGLIGRPERLRPRSSHAVGLPEVVALAGALGPSDAAAQWIGSLRHVALEIGGADLVAAGIPPGPAVGRGLRAALAARLDGSACGREAELARALQAARDSG